MLDLFRSTIYVRLQAERLRLLHVQSSRSLDEPPLLALRSTARAPRTVAASGKAALALQGQPGVELCNAFRHPRMLLADFNLAEKTLQGMLRAVEPAAPLRLRPAPLLVIHPLEHLEGGLTQVEIRALAELGYGCGSRKVFIWTGRELERHELEHLQFPAAGGNLLWPESKGST